MRSVAAGEVILRENDPAEALYMIVAGQVRLSFETPEALTRTAHVRRRSHPHPDADGTGARHWVVGGGRAISLSRHGDAPSRTPTCWYSNAAWLERRAEETA